VEELMEGAGFKDLTYSTFGLIIAFFVPGAISLFGLYLVSGLVKNSLDALLKNKETGLVFAGLTVAGLALGMTLNAIRRCVVSTILFVSRSSERWDVLPEEFENWGKRIPVTDYRAAMEEEWRQHQFYASSAMTSMMVLVWALLTCKWILGLVLLGVTIALVVAAVGTYRFYISLAKVMLGKGKSKPDA
jgi:hypothetical protein